jgi:hypothetical protein
MAPTVVPHRRLHAPVGRNDLPGTAAAQRARPGHPLLLIASHRARIRKSRWLTRNGAGGAVTNMTMIDKRPAEVETKKTAANWEDDLILGTGCASAMVTLRERKTQYGIVINLPHDYTAATVNQAVAGAMAALSRHLKKTLTWDSCFGVRYPAQETARPVFRVQGLNWPLPPASTSTSPNAPAPGSAAPTRTSTDCSARLPQGHRPVDPLPRPRRPRRGRAQHRPPTVTFKTLDRRPKQPERATTNRFPRPGTGECCGPGIRRTGPAEAYLETTPRETKREGFLYRPRHLANADVVGDGVQRHSSPGDTQPASLHAPEGTGACPTNRGGATTSASWRSPPATAFRVRRGSGTLST